MSLFRREPTEADRPQPNTVIAEPATVEACQADRAEAGVSYPAGHHTATPHTHGRRR